MKEQIIQLEPHDDIVSTRDRLGWVKASRVLLVLPDDPDRPILRRRLDLVLLKRETARHGASLALITRDPVVLEVAGELRIACFQTVEASHRRRWGRRLRRFRLPRRNRPTPLDASLVEAATRVQSGEGRLPPRSRRMLNFATSGLAIVLLASAGIAGIPSATVSLDPITNQVTAAVTIIADPQATQTDTVSGIIPARVVGVEVDGSATIATTGTADQPAATSRGTALFTNLLPDQVTIPAGTVIRTSAANPVRFVTSSDVTLPGQIGATIEVAIEAIEPGYEGNLPSNRINEVEGPLATHVAVTNPSPTQGGDVVEVAAISQEDYDRVRALVVQQLQQRAFALMQTDPYIALQTTEFIPEETLSVVLVRSETYSGYVEQPAEQVSLDVHAVVQGVAIDDLLARQVVYTHIADKVGTGFQILEGSLVFRHGEIVNVDEQRRVTFVMQGAGDVWAAIDSDEVMALIRGRPPRIAAANLESALPLASPPRVEVWPAFWPMMPLISARIDLQIGSNP